MAAKSLNPGQSCGYFAKSKMAAVCHFGIVMTLFKTIHLEYLVTLKFHSNKLLSFVDIKIFIFLRLLMGLPDHDRV